MLSLTVEDGEIEVGRRGAAQLVIVGESANITHLFSSQAVVLIGSLSAADLLFYPPPSTPSANALVVLSCSTAEDGEIEVRISLANALVVLSSTVEDGEIEVRISVGSSPLYYDGSGQKQVSCELSVSTKEAVGLLYATETGCMDVVEEKEVYKDGEVWRNPLITSGTNMLEPFDQGVLWVVVIGFIVAFVLAFGIGANDVANSFGTSVGSKVLSVKQACCYKVSDTMRKGILEVSMYEDSEKELMLGCLSSLAGSAVWLIVATFFKLPISGTHSIVGATVGFSLVCRGTKGLHWTTLAMIVASWFVSPVLSGIMSVILFSLIRRFILSAPQPIKPGLHALPFFYGVTIIINVFSIVQDGPKLLYFDVIPWWGALVISLGIGLIVMLTVQLVLVPYQRKQIMDDSNWLRVCHSCPWWPLVAKCANTDPVPYVSGDSRRQQLAVCVSLMPLVATDSSGDPTPKGSTEDVSRPLPKIGAIKEVTGPSGEMLPLTATDRGQLYHFPTPQTNGATTKSNGYVLAETALGDATQGGVSPAVTETAIAVANSVKKVAQPEPSTHQLQVVPESDKSIGGQVTPMCANSYGEWYISLFLQKQLDVEVIAEEMEESSGPEDPPEVVKLFSFLQVLTASFGSFAHGGNDVSNAIGPLIALWLIYLEGSVQQKSETPLYILLYGGFGITVGLWLWGRRVIKTIGEDLTKITASTVSNCLAVNVLSYSGFTIEIGAAFTVLLASKIGIPISTTHCKVGSVVFVGWANSSKGGVDWKLFR
uniref:Phosphate transporter n=1 Tax=Timema californicum TaxID=61474 RepID=A0A7R9J8I1_TIMCA|nr:unnamed protein product [Timema californicum]